MQRYDPADVNFEAALRAIWVDMGLHIREEATCDLEQLEENMTRADSEALGDKYESIKELLQKPYGKEGVPDARMLSAILEMPRQELMTKIGV